MVPSKNWSIAEEVVTHEKLKQAIDSMALMRLLGWMVSTPYYCNRGLSI